MKYKLIDSDKKLDTDDFLAVEKIIEKKIPSSMLEFYKRHNGGIVEGGRRIFIHPENGTEYEVKSFLPMIYARYKEDSSVEDSYIFFCKKERLIPENFIPFAIDSGGFVFCIGTEDEKIYFFNFDNEENSKELVADSLENFVDSLVTEDEAGF